MPRRMTLWRCEQLGSLLSIGPGTAYTERAKFHTLGFPRSSQCLSSVLSQVRRAEFGLVPSSDGAYGAERKLKKGDAEAMPAETQQALAKKKMKIVT